VLHTLFDLNQEPGLTDLVLDENADPALQQTQVKGLQLLASGPMPPNPADMLGSKRIDQVISSLAKMADFVLFDAPPAIAVTDASVLGAKVDGVLLVISAGKTRRDHAQRAKEMLERASVRIIGAALTNAPKDSSIGGYYR
jgi:non-specific protein-tyrosine kinase